MSKELANKLGLAQMVSENTDNHSTAFTVSIDHKDTTTGISAAEILYHDEMRGRGDEAGRSWRRPGHVFPLTARKGGGVGEKRSYRSNRRF